MKQQRPSTMKEKIPKWKYSSQVHEHLLPLTMFHRILVFKFQSRLKKFKIPCCNVHSLLANFYLARTPVNNERKISKKMTKSTSWKIYVCQQRRNFWFSRSGKLHGKSKITQCNKTRKRSKCFTHHIDPMLSYVERNFLFYVRLCFFLFHCNT